MCVLGFGIFDFGTRGFGMLDVGFGIWAFVNLGTWDLGLQIVDLGA